MLKNNKCYLYNTSWVIAFSYKLYLARNFYLGTHINYYHASDKIVGILLARSWSHDVVKITVLGVEIRIGRVIEFEAGGEQSKMADDGLVAMDISWWFSTSTDCLTVKWFEMLVLVFGELC